jgi:hypothetical protein
LISRTAAALIGAAALLSTTPADAKGRHGGHDRDDDRWERNERHGHRDYGHWNGHGRGHDQHGYAGPRWHAPAPFLPPLPPPPWVWFRPQVRRDYHRHVQGCGHAGYGYRAPVYDYGYWCKRCNHGWSARDDFYSHVYHQHQVPYPHIPGVVVNVGATWIFGY